MDLTLIIALSALAFSVASPVVSSAMNARHEEKMYRLKHFEQRKIDSITEYVRTTGSVIGIYGAEAIYSYGKAYGEAILYLPDPIIEEMKKLDRLISTREKGYAIRDSFNAVSHSIARFLPSLRG